MLPFAGVPGFPSQRPKLSPAGPMADTATFPRALQTSPDTQLAIHAVRSCRRYAAKLETQGLSDKTIQSEMR